MQQEAKVLLKNERIPIDMLLVYDSQCELLTAIWQYTRKITRFSTKGKNTHVRTHMQNPASLP
jgi:hypothetical protein